MTQRKTALVVGVGASQGLGAASARRFAREGLHVVVAGRTEGKLDEVVHEIKSAGGSIEALVADASIEDDAKRIVAHADRDDGLTLALHNAGGNRFDAFLDLPREGFEQLWREHTLGGFLIGREVARRMLPRGAGTILFAGASGSLRGKAGLPPSPRPKRAYAPSRKAWRANSGRRGFMLATSSSTAASKAHGYFRASPT